MSLSVRSQHNDPHLNLVFNFLRSQGGFLSKSCAWPLSHKSYKTAICSEAEVFLNCHYQKVFPSTVSSFMNLSHKKAASLQ